MDIYRYILFTVLCALCLVPEAPASAGQYSYTTITPPGWTWSYVHGINDNGDLVGYGGSASGTRGFLFRGEAFTELLPPGWSSAYALTVNNRGSIVGFGTVSGIDKAFLYREGTYAEIIPPGWSWVWGIRINENDDIVGGGLSGAGSRGFLYHGGSYTELAPPGWQVSTAYGINGRGLIVGWGTDGSGVDKGFVYDGVSYTELLPPGWISATAYNINDSGQVIGEGVDSEGTGKGYVYSSGQYMELHLPGWSAVVPEDISESGVVGGYGTEGTSVKGFVFENGTYMIVTAPDIPNTTVIGINNGREIVGVAYNPARGFYSALCTFPPVRIPGIFPRYYSGIQQAYYDAADNDVIQTHNIVFAGEISFNDDRLVTVSGGRDCDHMQENGASRVYGDMIISGGKVILENIVIE